VVKRGRMGVPSGVDKANFNGAGAKIEKVPVPVLGIIRGVDYRI
jgi:hypothetical protein